MVLTPVRAELKCCFRGSGAQCVMMVGIWLTLVLFARRWAVDGRSGRRPTQNLDQDKARSGSLKWRVSAPNPNCGDAGLQAGANTAVTTARMQAWFVQLSHVLIGNVLIEIVAGKQWHLRLENGGSRCDGRVEIYHDGTWGRLLDDSWNISNADVICRQLNFGSAISVYNSSQYGEGTGPVWINNVQCAGTETHIWNCPYSTVASSSRTSRDVGVLCSGECTLDTHIRLMDGGSSCAGRVEIYYNATWGTVCDDSWGSLEADVVCKQLGCGSAVDAIFAAPCGSASGQVWLDEVRCSGKESALWECASSPWGQHDCGHKEDVSIVCSEHKMLRLVNGQHSCEGRVEVFYNET
eukprot:gi/632985667/ref/XP_007909811.1/ PREDICTED: deleted in malignant brain tumors 1 protein-like [Callorhinchus milii]